MNRKQAKKLQEAFNHFVNGGELWCYYESKEKWDKQDSLLSLNYPDCNIIKDKHFEARKAFALGGEIETSTFGEVWELVTDESALWTAKYYRPKSIYEYQWWYFIPDLNRFQLSIDFYTEEEDKSRIPSTSLTKFEPSKRVKQ